MDFRGSTGRVINDPSEIAMIEKEQDLSWRRRLCTRNANSCEFYILIVYKMSPEVAQA